MPSPTGSTNSTTASLKDTGKVFSARRRSLNRSVSVDTSKARSNADCVRLCLSELGWTDYPNGRSDGRPCDIYWHSIVFQDMKDYVTTGRVNKFPGMNEMAKKISLTHAISLMQRLSPDDYNFYPKSWFIPAQLADFYEDYYAVLEQNTGRLPWFIVKPDDGSQGTGIYLIQSPEQLQRVDEPQVVQEYVSDPYLMGDKLKFDLRIYAVVKSISPLSIYIYKEGMARFCTVRYRQPSISNSAEAYMHLTNYSLNKYNENFIISKDSAVEGSKRLLSSVFHQMEAKGINTRKVWQSIKLIIVKTILAMVPEMILYYENQYSGAQGPQCFHILGFDILLTKNLDPILLEINACPSLSINHQISDLEDIAPSQSIVDGVIKIPLVRDTLLLAMDMHQGRTTTAGSTNRKLSADDFFVGADDQRFTLREVFPSQFGATCSHLLILHKAAYLYLHFVNIRRTMVIGIGGVRNLIRKCNLQDIMSYAQADLLYSKLQKFWTVQHSTGVPFHGFAELLFEIAQRKFPHVSSLLECLKLLLHHCELQLRYHGVKSARLRAETVQTLDASSNMTFQEVYLLPRIVKKTPVMFPKI